VGQKPGPKGDLNPAYNEIARNFFIGNYGASMAIDNDDGSSYYNIRQNFEGALSFSLLTSSLASLLTSSLASSQFTAATRATSEGTTRSAAAR